MKDKVSKSEAEWREQLTADEFYVTREKGTEQAFTGQYYNSHELGIYSCICCGNDLFDSEKKFDSGTGWPSYWKPISDDAVTTEEDRSLGTIRTEVTCSKCDAHLGHVFPDGPPPTGLRYCINSLSLKKRDKQ